MDKVWTCLVGDIRASAAGPSDRMEAIVFGSFLRELERLPDHVQAGWVPTDERPLAQVPMGEERMAWAIIIGSVSDDQLPPGADAPMRNAATYAWRTAVPGVSYQYMRSGWMLAGSDQVRDRAREWFGSTSIFA